MKRLPRIAAILPLLAGASLAAQTPSSFDRTKAPAPAPTPAFKMPASTVETLSNGARLVVVERHELPVVTLSIHFGGGTNQLGTKEGVSGFLGAMLREGTATRSADQLNNDLALLGTNVALGVGSESGSAGFSGLVRNFDATAAIMMDMMLHSTFPGEALERLRTQSLAAYTRGQDNPPTVAGQVAPGLLYGDHPYGKVVTDADLKAVTRDDVAGLARQLFVPVNATVYVVGDLTREEARRKLELAFAGWPAGGTKVAFGYPTPPPPAATTIYLVDMPNKPQSFLRINHMLPPAYGPDMAKVDVMNRVVGGNFQSRLNLNIREVHGYSYGFNSGVSWLKGPGPMSAGGLVTREKTDSSLIEAMKELRGMTGSTPVTAAELTAAKNSLTLSLPSQLQSNAGVLNVVSRIVDENLPPDWWAQYITAVNATTATEVAEVARKYLDPDRLVILIVGDGAKIRDAVKATGIAPVVPLDKSGKRIAQAAPGTSRSGDQPLVVSTAWLAERFRDPGLVLFHIGEPKGYQAGHIPGAQFLAPTTELSTPRVEGQLSLELPSIEVLDSVLEAKGISDDSRIVLYSADQYFTPTSRALFTLEYAGLRGRVSILDGGLEAWKADGRTLTTEVASVSRGRVTPRPDRQVVVDADYVRAHLADRSVRIVDTRDSSFYNGRETRQGRNGHIPGAANVPFHTIMDSTGKFRPAAMLKAQFSAVGVTDGQTVVTYCHIGQQASLVWFAARLLGFNAKLYDGSFQDWARRKELPVEGERKP